MINRRKFIISAGGVAGVAAGGGAWATLVQGRVEDSVDSKRSTESTASTGSRSSADDRDSHAAPAADRVLVVLEMAGGNDALNTLVPSVAAYRSARPDLAVPEPDLLTLSGTDEYGLHPSLAPLIPYWESGSMAAVQGIGMLEQSRSHFKAMDTWWSATPGVGSTTGWLGRWLDATLEGDPDPLRAIALGGGSSALVSLTGAATVVRSPAQFPLRTTDASDAEALIAAFVATAEPLAADPVLAAAQRAILVTIEAINVFDQVTGGDGPDQAAGRSRPNQDTAESLLRTAVGIIDLGIGTRVITVGISGFDTHANQATTHANLLADVAAGIAGFFAQLDATGHRAEVMLITTSEFGRRVAQNGSDGTDHGNAGTQFLLGPTVNGGQVVGELDLINLINGDVPTTVDTRSLYSAALDWLGGPTDELLGGPHDRLGLVA